MLSTADHDDRVGPTSYIQTMQYELGLSIENNSPQTNPIIARIEVKAGHGAGRPTQKILSKTAQAHARILKSGAHNDGYISAKLIASYSNHSCFDDANLVLQSIPDPNVYSFSSLIYALTKAKLSVPSYRLFELVNRFIAQRVRASGLDGDGFVQGSLFHMYMRCGKMFDARKVFDRMREREETFGFNRSGCHKEAVVMFQKMHHLGFLPDEVAVSSVLPSVGDSERLDIGRQIHGYFELMETGVCNACITGLSRNGLVDKAVEMFGLFKEKNMELNVVSWTSIIAGCAQNGKDIEALELFREMQVAGVKPNRVTIPSMLPACGNIAALLHGRSAHGFAVRLHLLDDVHVGIDIGYSMHGKAKEVMSIFESLVRARFKPDFISFTSLLSACSQMDGFVLPPFESNCVLKDKDIVCVKRKKEPLLEVVEEDSEENVCAAIEAEERAPGAMLLANEEFQKGTGGYESESEEDELEEIVVEKKTSKKRKASSKIISSKRKKCKLATTEESPVERECEVVVSKGNAVKKSKTSDARRTESGEQNDVNAKSMTKYKKSSKQAESKEPTEQCNISGETKKTPSRSARRKKAKRQWLREKTKLEKEEYLQLKQKQMVVAPSQKPAFTTNHQVTKENRSEALEPQQPDEVVPVEVRPGHIRFETLDETDQASAEEIAPPAEKFVWNGNMTKKKGQKWGTEKAGLSKRYAQHMNEDTYQTETEELGVEYDEDVGLSLQAYSDLIPHEVARSAPPKPVQTATNPKLSSDNGLQTPVKELSDALSAKKAQLAQANNGGWNKKGSSSGGSAWSYKALRGSGMGPVMNYIKSFESHSGRFKGDSQEKQSLGCESSQGNQILLSKVFRKLVEKIWERVGGEDVRERIKQLKEEYEKWRKEREEECEKWWKDAEEEEAAEEKEEKAEKEEEEAERDDIEEEEEEEETKWSKMDEVMEHICEAGDPFVWGN
ncbi:hypothetical protein Bca4012_070333 [Brassica carinata]